MLGSEWLEQRDLRERGRKSFLLRENLELGSIRAAADNSAGLDAVTDIAGGLIQGLTYLLQIARSDDRFVAHSLRRIADYEQRNRRGFARGLPEVRDGQAVAVLLHDEVRLLEADEGRALRIDGGYRELDVVWFRPQIGGRQRGQWAQIEQRRPRRRSLTIVSSQNDDSIGGPGCDIGSRAEWNNCGRRRGRRSARGSRKQGNRAKRGRENQSSEHGRQSSMILLTAGGYQ